MRLPLRLQAGGGGGITGLEVQALALGSGSRGIILVSRISHVRAWVLSVGRIICKGALGPAAKVRIDQVLLRDVPRCQVGRQVAIGPVWAKSGRKTPPSGAICALATLLPSASVLSLQSESGTMGAGGSRLRQALLLLSCVAGIYASYLTQGVVQETLSTKKFGPQGERFTHLSSLNAVQCWVCFIWAALLVALFDKR